MILTVFNSEPVYLLDVAPDWSDSAPAADVDLISRADAGLSDREARRPHSLSLRFRLKFSLTAEGKDARRIAGALRDLKDEAVAVPLWPAVVEWADRGTRPIGAGLNVVFKEDWSHFEIYLTGAEPGWPAAGDLVAPLLWAEAGAGLQNREVMWATPNRFTWMVDFIEASPVEWAMAPAVAVFAAGPVPSVAYGAGPKVFPFDVNFLGVKERFTISIVKESLGFGRVPAKTFYDQAVAREEDSEPILDSTGNIGLLLEFFRQHGAGKSFWAPSWVNACELTAAIGPADTVLNVSDTVMIEAGDWIGFLEDGVSATARVLVVGANTITVDAAPGAFSIDTVVCHLNLVRFLKPSISVQWRSGELAECTMQLRELPAEYTPAGDETLGVTIGVVPTRAWLYEFARVLDGVTYTERYTSFEGDLLYGGNNYSRVKQLSHGEIQQGLVLDKDEVEVKMDLLAGSGLVLLATLKLEAPLMVTIIQAETADGVHAINGASVFVGEAISADVVGSRITGKVVTGSSRFDQQVPRMLFQLTDNFPLFSDGNGLAKADWKFTAKMHTVGGGGYPFQFVLDTIAGSGASAIAALAGGAVFAHWFAGGWMELNSGGASWQRRAILDSTAIAAGLMTVTLDRDPNPFPVVADSVALYPGYDLRDVTSKAFDATYRPESKFNNYANFGGHPFLPIANPSVSPQAKTPGGGKK